MLNAISAISEPLFSSILALIAAICWGINSHLIRIGVKEGDLFLGLFFRALFAFPILLFTAIFISDPNVISIYFSFNIITTYLLLSVILILIGDGLFMLALKEFKVNVIMPIGGIYPLVTISILILTGTEVISGFVLIGTLLIIVGVSLVTRYGSNDGKKPVSKKAVLFGLGSAVCWGSSVFLVRQVLNSPGSDPTSLTGFRMLMLGLLSVSIYYFLRNGNEKIDTRTKQDKRKTIIYLGLSGIVGWVIGATIFFVAVQNIGASIPTPISSLNPIVAVIIGYIFKIEAINKKQFLGVLTSVLGTIVIVL